MTVQYQKLAATARETQDAIKTHVLIMARVKKELKHCVFAQRASLESIVRRNIKKVI